MPLSLRKLLCNLYTGRREYEAHVFRYAATVAARRQADIFTATQIEALINAFANGEIAKAVHSQELHRSYVTGWIDEGERLAKDDDAKKLGIPAFARRMWEVAVSLVVRAWEQAQPGLCIGRSEDVCCVTDYCCTDLTNSLDSEHLDVFCVANYCCRALTNSLNSDDGFAHAVELLDRDGFTDWLLRELWRECPEEAEYRELPKPRDTRPPMTDGQKRLWDALSGCAMTEKKLADRNQLDTSEQTVRSWVLGLRRAGYGIERRKGRGYYRPDAPPDDVT